MKLLLAVLIIIISLNINAQQKAPNFKLEDLNGEYVELKNLLGKGPLLISFWATWCKPCVEELSEYKKLYSEYKAKGFNIIAISTDDEKTVAKVKPFVKSKDYNFTVLLDTNSEVARKYYVRNVPYTFLLDEKGNIVYSHLGHKKGDELQVKKKVEALLSSSPVKTSD
ncbi:MAG: TlpA disulfide reductase family protein [Ignavibacteria bacterium]|nr:TlpA disulfide reductase family protein [Ignavibacteria bacterium]